MSDLIVIDERNLAVAWWSALNRLLAPSVTRITPLIVSINGFDAGGGPIEAAGVREAVNAELLASGRPAVETSANTIFPRSLWNPSAADDATVLFERFRRIWPRLQRCRGNCRGHYFARMTGYQPLTRAEGPINQLEQVIAAYRSGARRGTALQAAIVDPIADVVVADGSQVAVFDPTRDHSLSRRQGFPCLQQVAFAPDGDGGLAVTGLYGAQYVFDRGYGNYLGLCGLGAFMAKQFELRLSRVTCIANVALLSSGEARGGGASVTKTSLRALAARIEPLVLAGSTTAPMGAAVEASS